MIHWPPSKQNCIILYHKKNWCNNCWSNSINGVIVSRFYLFIFIKMKDFISWPNVIYTCLLSITLIFCQFNNKYVSNVFLQKKKLCIKCCFLHKCYDSYYKISYRVYLKNNVLLFLYIKIWIVLTSKSHDHVCS